MGVMQRCKWEADAASVLQQVDEIARWHFDGHFTLMAFTTNWRAGFGTPEDRADVTSWGRAARTPIEALRNALEDWNRAGCSVEAYDATARKRAQKAARAWQDYEYTEEESDEYDAYAVASGWSSKKETEEGAPS